MTRSARLALAAALLFAGGGCGAGTRVEGGLARDEGQRNAVIALLGIDSGDTVLDLGVCGDWFPRRFEEAVGNGGRVLTRAPDGGASSLADLDGSVDLLFVCNAYHRISDPLIFFRDALAALVPNGRVAIVEDEAAGGTSGGEIAREMREAGYEQLADHAILPRGSFQIFRADDGTGE
jgi:arsenite methyltransferase